MDLQSAAGMLGTLTLAGDQLSPFEQEVIDFGVLATSLILAKEAAVATTEERLRGRLIEELLIDHGASEDLVRRRAHAAGISLASPCLVVVATPPAVHSLAPRASAAALAVGQASATGVIDGMLVSIWPGTDAIAAGRAIAAALRGADSVKPTVSVAGPATGVTELRKAYRHASASIPLIRALGREGTIVTAADLQPYTAIFRAADTGELRGFIEGALGGLIAYDECHRGGLLRTLEAYLDESGNMARTARTLHTHVNTLYQRLARLDCLLGDDWRQSERRLELHLALRLMRLSDRLAHVDG
jgi:sugar diacid utilization regulator